MNVICVGCYQSVLYGYKIILKTDHLDIILFALRVNI